MAGMVVFVTVPQDKATALAKVILKEKLVACVNIIKNVQSYFWWEGKIVEEKEAMLIIKTKKTLFKSLEKTIKEHHPYTVPEIIGLEIKKINKNYLDWLIQETPP